MTLYNKKSILIGMVSKVSFLSLGMQVSMWNGSQSMVRVAPQPEVWYVGSEHNGNGIIILEEKFLGGDGYPLLLRAAAKNRPDEVEALIKEGADIGCVRIIV